MRDLMVALDDADGRILDARFVEQESQPTGHHKMLMTRT
jgi:hypothetical protein